MTGERRASVLITPGPRDISSRQGYQGNRKGIPLMVNLRLRVTREVWMMTLLWTGSGLNALTPKESILGRKKSSSCRHCLNFYPRSVESTPQYTHSGEWMSKLYCTSNSFLDGIRLRSEEVISDKHE